jgi:hypothetical protein
MHIRVYTSEYDLDIGERMPPLKQTHTIPAGSWAVILTLQFGPNSDNPNADLQTKPDIEVVGRVPHEWRVIKQTVRDGQLTQTLCLWSREPFMVIERWQVPSTGSWAHLARKVTQSGLGRQLPRMKLPNYAVSYAGRLQPQPQISRWYCVATLAKHFCMDAHTLLSVHAPLVQGIDGGIHVLHAEDASGVTRAATHALLRPCAYSGEWHVTAPEHTWVRHRFAVVAAYCALLDLHERH